MMASHACFAKKKSTTPRDFPEAKKTWGGGSGNPGVLYPVTMMGESVQWSDGVMECRTQSLQTHGNPKT